MQHMSILLVTGLLGASLAGEPLLALHDGPRQAQSDGAVGDAKHDFTLSDADRAAIGVSDAEFAREMEVVLARFARSGRPASAEGVQLLKDNLVRKFAEEHAIAQRAKAEGVTVTAKELANALAEQKRRAGGNAAFLDMLKHTNQTEASVKADLGKRLLLEKLLDKVAGSTPTDEEAKQHYEANLALYKQPETVTASNIFFPIAEGASPQEKEATLTLVQQVLANARQPGVEFSALIKKYARAHKDQTGPQAFQRSPLASPFETAAFAANAGDIVGPVESEGGYYIIKIHAKTAERQLSFEEAKELVVTVLKERQRSKARRELGTLKATAEP